MCIRDRSDNDVLGGPCRIKRNNVPTEPCSYRQLKNVLDMPSDGYDGMFLTEKLVTTWVSEDIAGGCELQSRALETPVASPYDYLYNGSGQLGALSSLRPSLFHIGVHPSPPLPHVRSTPLLLHKIIWTVQRRWPALGRGDVCAVKDESRFALSHSVMPAHEVHAVSRASRHRKQSQR